MTLNLITRCEGAMVGHAVASNNDPSVLLAINVAESLLACGAFDRRDILARHLFTYHQTKAEIGATTKLIYESACQRRSGTIRTYQELIFEQSEIDRMVADADQALGGNTAGCAPAQRSYPLAFCKYISDDDLYACSVQEAKLTHASPIAGQVAAVVNQICRSLLLNLDFREAINAGFSEGRLHQDIKTVALYYGRRATPPEEKSAAYAPTVLCTSLHYFFSAKSADEAIRNAQTKDKHYAAPITGILAGARWGMPAELFAEGSNEKRLNNIRLVAGKLSSIWPTKQNAPHA